MCPSLPKEGILTPTPARLNHEGPFQVPSETGQARHKRASTLQFDSRALESSEEEAGIEGAQGRLQRELQGLASSENRVSWVRGKQFCRSL